MSHESDGPQAGTFAEIRWVGEQRLMGGYCGRAPAPATEPAAGAVAGEGGEARPVAPVRAKPRQRPLVRVGPPRGELTASETPQVAA